MTDQGGTQDPETPRRVRTFETTQWIRVIVAGKGEGTDAAAALEYLCRTYWYPLYAYVRQRGYGVEEAQDLTQEFFSRLLARNWLSQADPSRGRFRSFLLSSVNHFLANEWDRSHTAKRGGQAIILSLDGSAEARYALDSMSDLNPERVYERRWAASLLDQVLVRLREHYARADKLARYEALQGFLSTEATLADCTRLAAEWGTTPRAVGAAVHRLRSRFRELLCEEVARTVASPDDIEDEMRALCRMWE